MSTRMGRSIVSCRTRSPTVLVRSASGPAGQGSSPVSLQERDRSRLEEIEARRRTRSLLPNAWCFATSVESRNFVNRLYCTLTGLSAFHTRT